MKHNTCRDNLSAYLDGEMHEDEREALEAHLAECAQCRAELEQLKGVSGLLKKHVMEPVPQALKEAVLGKPRLAMPWLKPVLALSAAAAALMVVFNLTRPDEANYMASAGFGSRDGSGVYDMGASAGSSLDMMKETAAPAAPPQETDKKAGSVFATTAVRGSFAQAKSAGRFSGMTVGAGAKGISADAAEEATPAAAGLAGGGDASGANDISSEEALKPRPSAARAGKPAGSSDSCFCIGPARGDSSFYSIMRVPGARCAKEAFSPRRDSSAAGYLPACAAPLPQGSAVDMQEACFCVSVNPSGLPPYTLGRIESPDCSGVRFTPRPGLPATEYLKPCAP